MAKTVEPLSNKHGMMLVTDDMDFLHCCMECEVASSLGSVSDCPQRIHTSNSCCPSCSKFLEHGKEAMLAHYQEIANFYVAFQIVVPLSHSVTEDVIRSVFHLEKVPTDRLMILFEWKDWTCDVVFRKYNDWVMTIKHNYWPLDLQQELFWDTLVYGLAGFPERAGARVFTYLQSILDSFIQWINKTYPGIDPTEIFKVNTENSKNLVSYYISYHLRIENADNMTIDILAPDYEHSEDPEVCMVRLSDPQIPVVAFKKMNDVLVMQKGLLSSWNLINPALQNMLSELSLITSEMRNIHARSSVAEVSELLDRTQTIQVQFLKLKPSISTMQGHMSSFIPLLADENISGLIPTFNESTLRSWIDFTQSVERSLESANSYITGKLNLLALNQEKRTTKRINLLTALFGSLSGLNLIVAFLSWATPNPTYELLIFSGCLILVFVTLSLIFAGKTKE